MSGSLGGVDASIPLRAGQGLDQTNPLQMMQQFATIQNALNQNKLFPLLQQRLQLGNQQSQLDLTKAKNQAAYAAILPYINAPGFNHEALTNAMAAAEAQGIDTAPIMAGINRGVPQGDGPGFQQSIRSIVGAGALTDPNAQHQINYLMPGVGPVINTGPTQQGTQVAPQSAPNPGALTPSGPGVGVGYLTPAQKVEQVPGPVGPGGVPTSTTRGNLLRMQGIDPNTGEPIANPAFNNIRSNLPPALRNPAAENRPIAPIPMGISPAQQSAQSATGTNSANTYQNISNQGASEVGRRTLLQNMAAEAANFNPGPGTDKLKAVQSLFQAWAPKVAASLGIDPSKLASREDFDKMANQIADAQGAGSDARLAVNQGSNPSSHNTSAGLSLILHQLIGNSDYGIAKAKLADAYARQNGAASVQQFQSQIANNPNLDPRVFQFYRMTPGEQKDYLGQLAATGQRNEFIQHAEWVKQQGLLGGGGG